MMYDYIGAMGSIVPLSILTPPLVEYLWITCGNLWINEGRGGADGDLWL